MEGEGERGPALMSNRFVVVLLGELQRKRLFKEEEKKRRGKCSSFFWVGGMAKMERKKGKESLANVSTTSAAGREPERGREREMEKNQPFPLLSLLLRRASPSLWTRASCPCRRSCLLVPTVSSSRQSAARCANDWMPRDRK